MEKRWQSADDVVQEIMKIHRSLPKRPGIDEVEAAKTLIQNVEKEDQGRLEAIAKQTKSPGIPEELFMVLQEMQKNEVYLNSKEQKREALRLLDIENFHSVFDDLIQRAANCVSSSSSPTVTSSAKSNITNSRGSVTTLLTTEVHSKPSTTLAASGTSATLEPFKKATDLFSRDDSFLKKPKSSFYADGIEVSPKGPILDPTLRPELTSGEDRQSEKLSLIKLASLIEVSAKKGTRDLNLRNKLIEKIEWLPESIGKLSSLITLDLSENQLVALPDSIGGLSSLTRLDLHSNRLAQLPDAIGDLLSLVYLDLAGNHLSHLPAGLGRLVRLEELNLNSNDLSVLPDFIGSLVSLKKLHVETNVIEEIPHTIGQCSSLEELHADYNHLKALPEAVGRIGTLQVLSVRYNSIRQLPTTMSSLPHLKELDVSFNELESVPESLCFATTLVKLNVGNNFADLRSLPRAIGNLEMLEELDISNNQIRVLPDTFAMLKKLRVLRVEENPLEVPPRHIADSGAQAVVQYMADLVEKKNTRPQPIKPKRSWKLAWCFHKGSKRKRHPTGDA